jgi:peptidoglycan hydrolase-like protein with peptidoglycan-binding domain
VPDEGAVLDAATLRLGDTGHEVAAATAYFTRFGYFENPELRSEYPRWKAIAGQPPANAAVFGEELEHAVRAFQGRSGLSVTGELDEPTLELMAKPRCGVPDSLEEVATGVEDKWAAHSPADWRSNHTVSYSVDPIPPEFRFPDGTTWSRSVFRAELLKAFKIWGRSSVDT